MSEDDPAARPRRRSFSAEYKLGILAEYEADTSACRATASICLAASRTISSSTEPLAPGLTYADIGI